MSEFVLRPAGADKSAIRLIASGSAWSIVDAAESSEDGDGEQSAEASAVASWLGDLQSSTSGAYIAEREVNLGDSAAAAAIIEAIYRAGDGRDGDRDGDRLTFYRHPEHGLIARRNDEPAFMQVDVQPQAGRILTAWHHRFRRRQILSLEPYGLRRAVARRGTRIVAELNRGELLEDWTAKIPADRKPLSQAIDALRELARLRAVAFVGRDIQRAWGLTPPALRIELTFDPGPMAAAGEPATQRVLEVGARAGTDVAAPGCYARIASDPTVFVIDPATCDTLPEIVGRIELPWPFTITSPRPGIKSPATAAVRSSPRFSTTCSSIALPRPVESMELLESRVGASSNWAPATATSPP